MRQLPDTYEDCMLIKHGRSCLQRNLPDMANDIFWNQELPKAEVSFSKPYLVRCNYVAALELSLGESGTFSSLRSTLHAHSKSVVFISPRIRQSITQSYLIVFIMPAQIQYSKLASASSTDIPLTSRIDEFYHVSSARRNRSLCHAIVYALLILSNITFIGLWLKSSSTPQLPSASDCVRPKLTFCMSPSFSHFQY
jgi:hypothetical protein